MAQTGTASASSKDRALSCSECGATFIFTAGEQEFYAAKGFTPPKRCPGCRERKRQERESRGR